MRPIYHPRLRPAQSSDPLQIVDPTDMGHDQMTVECVDNHAYFYSGVDTDRCLALIKMLREIDGRLLTERMTRGIPAGYPGVPIWLHINSGGGDVMSAFAIADQLKAIQSPVYSVVEGMCASAATVISMACKRRFITPASFMLIHQVSSVAWGTHDHFRDHLTLLDMLETNLVNFYSSRSNGLMTRETAHEIMRRDSWFDASECVRLGLVDEETE